LGPKLLALTLFLVGKGKEIASSLATNGIFWTGGEKINHERQQKEGLFGQKRVKGPKKKRNDKS